MRQLDTAERLISLMEAGSLPAAPGEIDRLRQDIMDVTHQTPRDGEAARLLLARLAALKERAAAEAEPG